MSEGKNLSLQRCSSLKGSPSGRKQRENDREHVAEKLQRPLPKFNQFSENGVFGRPLSITSALHRADASVRDEVRSVASVPVATVSLASDGARNPARQKARLSLGRAIDFLLRDEELRSRTRDLLLASRHYDRALREASTVLDDRLKKLSGIAHMNPGDLVGKVLNSDLTRAVIVVSSDKQEQEGFFLICKGLMQTFRNAAHHKLSSAFSQADALNFCGFVDTMLAVIGKGEVHPERR